MCPTFPVFGATRYVRSMSALPVGPSASLVAFDLLSGSRLEKSGFIGVDPICERI
jgi:hypothetical protein